MDTNALKPTFSLRLQSRTAVQRAPLWLMKPTLPGRAMLVANVAFRPIGGHHDAEAIRADDAHAAAARFGEDFLLEGHAFGAGFLEAGGDDDRARDAGFDAILDDARNAFRRRANHGQVHFFRHGRNAGEGFHAEHRAAFGIDRVDDPLESAAAQVLEDRPADAADVLGGADDGDDFGSKNGIQGMSSRAQNVMGGLDGLGVGFSCGLHARFQNIQENSCNSSPLAWPTHGVVNRTCLDPRKFAAARAPDFPLFAKK